MMGKLIYVILAFFCAEFSMAQGSGEFSSKSGGAFEFGSRPPLSVFDPGELLLPEKVKEISDQLAKVYQDEGIDIIVVVLADLGNASPEHVARLFAREWCSSSICCVVLHVPGREGSPWIVPDGDLLRHLNPEQVKIAIENVRRRTAAEPKDIDKVKAAATEAEDMLRFWLANAVKLSDVGGLEATTRNSMKAEEIRTWTMGVILAAGAAVVFLVGSATWIIALRKKRPRYFGLPTIGRRLGAPYAGGNHAVVDLGPPPL